MKNDNLAIKELLTRGVAEVINAKELESKLKAGKKLRIKLGIDPTSPNIHIGRAVVLLKLREFQELGHKVVLIVGDFTGLIGDTSDKESERPMLTAKQVKENMKNYLEQAGKILDLKKTETHFNSTWLKKLGYLEIGEQADKFGLSDFIARENIKKRLDGGKRVSLRELLYPLMQAYDSVAIKADVELGGTDQRFNLLAGRTLQPHYKQSPQNILMVNLIMGTDGRKMSSSWGNVINVTDKPNDMFGKVMSISDELIIPYFIHCTRVEMSEIAKHQKALSNGKTNPRNIKVTLAKAITALYWGENEAVKAEQVFVNVFQKKDMPKNIKTFKGAGMNVVDLLVEAGLAMSKSEARRLIQQAGIKVGGQTVKDASYPVPKNTVVQRGQRMFIKVI